ncbi:MAG: choice-of-anchor P family protein, partial [Gaiellaceae bacterium]
MIRVTALAGAALVLSTALAAAAPPLRSASTGASATLARITIPGQQTVSLGELTWPTNVSSDVQSFEYPNDGSIVSIGRSRAKVSAQPGEAAAAQASAEVIVLSLFNGEVVAGRLTATTTAGASARTAGGSATGSTVDGLRALGQDVSSAPGSTVPLGDWGSLTVLSDTSGSRKKPAAAQGAVVALRVALSAAHG